MPSINISKANKAEVLMRLFNGGANWGAARTEGLQPLGVILQELIGGITLEQAAELLLSRDLCFDYVRGRSFKVDFSEDVVDLWLYERDAGAGAARRALKDVAGVEFID
jgi:hypothetical protein